jgi:hypothetical protein
MTSQSHALGGLKKLVISISASLASTSIWPKRTPPPTTKQGPPGDLFGVLGHAARAAAGLFRQLGRQGRSRTRRISGGFRGGLRGDGSFRGGGLRGGGLRGDNLSRLGGCVRAGLQDFRAIDRADLRHAEPLARKPALAHGVSGGGSLSERHGEGTTARGPEFASQALSLLQFCRDYGFGGFRCRLGRRCFNAL